MEFGVLVPNEKEFMLATVTVGAGGGGINVLTSMATGTPALFPIYGCNTYEYVAAGFNPVSMNDFPVLFVATVSPFLDTVTEVYRPLNFNSTVVAPTFSRVTKNVALEALVKFAKRIKRGADSVRLIPVLDNDDDSVNIPSAFVCALNDASCPAAYSAVVSCDVAVNVPDWISKFNVI